MQPTERLCRSSEPYASPFWKLLAHKPSLPLAFLVTQKFPQLPHTRANQIQQYMWKYMQIFQNWNWITMTAYIQNAYWGMPISTLIMEGCLCLSLNLPSLASPSNSYKWFFLPSLSKSCLSFRIHFLHEANSSSLAHINSISQSAITCLQLLSNCVMFSDYLIFLIFKYLNQLNFLKGKKKNHFFLLQRLWVNASLCHLCIQCFFSTKYSGYWEWNSQLESSALRELNVRERQGNRLFYIIKS